MFLNNKMNLQVVLIELLKYHEMKKHCINCDCAPIDVKCTRDIFFETYTFCSEWCQRDFEYDLRKNYQRKEHIK